MSTVIHDLADAAVESIDRFQQKFLTATAEWMTLFPVLYDGRELTSRKLVDLSGIGLFTEQAADGAAPAPSKLYKGGKSYEAPTVEISTMVKYDDLDTNPGLLNDIADRFFMRAFDSIGSMAFGALATIDTEEHPDDRMRNSGGRAYICDDFTSPVVQSNKTTTALSGSAVNTAKTILSGWKDKDGIVMGKATGARYGLVVHNNQRPLANDLVNRSQELVVGSSIEQSTAAGLVGAWTNPFNDDEDEWQLVDLDDHPIVIWLPRGVIYTVEPVPGAGRLAIYGSVRRGLIYKPSEYGIVQNTPA